MVDHCGRRLLQLATAGVAQGNAVIIIAGRRVGDREGSQRLFGTAQFTLGARARLQDGIDGHVLVPFTLVKWPAMGRPR